METPKQHIQTESIIEGHVHCVRVIYLTCKPPEFWLEIDHSWKGLTKMKYLASHRKALVAYLGVIFSIVIIAVGPTNHWIELVAPILTALGVHVIPNADQYY